MKKIILAFLVILIGCEQDEVQEESLCDELICDLVCENGYITDENGCELCDCIYFGCTDEDATNYDELANTDDESCIYNYVYAGVYDENFIVTEFSPPLNIEIVWDKDNIYGFGVHAMNFLRLMFLRI